MPSTFEDVPFQSENHVKNVIRGILQGMEILHKNNVTNVNLKVENILFDRKGQVKLRDYLAKDFFEMIVRKGGGESF